MGASVTRVARVFDEKQQICSKIKAVARTVADSSSGSKEPTEFYVVGNWVPEKGTAEVYHFSSTAGADVMTDSYKRWNYSNIEKKFTSHDKMGD